MSRFAFAIDTGPEPTDVQFLEDRINEYNFETTGITDGELLSIFLRDQTGKIQAGIYGWTWGGCCEIRTLWVDPDLRKQGIGSHLLMAAEKEARRRKCRQITLDTHSFQAPDFYVKYGYQIVGRVLNYPRGYENLLLVKSLD